MRIEPLDDGEYLLLTTYRPGGEAVPVPVRLAGTAGRFVCLVDDGDELLERAEANSRAEIAACTSRGKILPGAAVLAASVRVLEDEVEASEKLVRRKYGLWRRSAQAGQGIYRRARSLEEPTVRVVEITLNEAI